MASYQVPLKNSAIFVSQYWIYTEESSGTTNPAGSNQQIQFNDSGQFGADSDFYYNKNENKLYVPYASFSSDLLVSTNLFKTDSSNSKIAINKSTPDYTLDVSGDINFTGNLRKNGVIQGKPAGSNTQIQYNSNNAFGADSNFYYDDSDNILYVPYANVGDDLVVRTDLLKTDSANGKIGINKASPNYTLDVSGDINYTGNLRKNGVAQSSLTIGGSDTQIQFNSNGSLNGSSNLTWNNTTKTLTTWNLVSSNYFTLSGIANTVKDYILYYDITSKQITYGLFPTGGSSNSIQYKSGNKITGSSTFTYDDSVGNLNIETNTGSPYIRVRELTYTTSKVDLSPDGLTCREPNSDDSLAEFLYNQSKTPKQYLTGTQSNSRTGKILVRADDDGEITSDTNISYNESTNTLLCNKLNVSSDLTVSGQLNTSSIIIAGTATSSTGLSNAMPAGGTVNQIVAKNSSSNYDYSWTNISNLIYNSITGSTNQILARTASSVSFQGIASLLINSLSSGSVGQYLQLQASNTLGWATVSSSSSGSSLTTQNIAEFSLTSNSSAINSSSAGSPYSSIYTVAFNNTVSNTISGVSNSSGTITLPFGGLYHISASIKWGNWSQSYRIVWINCPTITSSKIGENWINQQSASGGGSPFINAQGFIDLRSATSNTTFTIQTSQLSGSSNVSTAVESGSRVYITRIS